MCNSAENDFRALRADPVFLGLSDFEVWRMSPGSEAACAAVQRGDPTTALREAFEAGQRCAKMQPAKA